MAYIQGEGRSQGSLFPVVLDDLIPVDHMCRVIDAFVARLALSEHSRGVLSPQLERARSQVDPRDLLKLYLYGYLNQIRSSRRLEAECRRSVELMWLLGRFPETSFQSKIKTPPRIPPSPFRTDSTPATHPTAMIDNTIPHPSTTFAGAMSQLVRSDSGSFRITGP
jgi:hypothetical protein